MRWLSEDMRQKVGKVILVAPYIGTPTDYPMGKEYEKIRDKFFNFKIDTGIANKTHGLTIFESTDDHGHIKRSIDLLVQYFGNSVKRITLENRGHFTTDEKWVPFPFPELLEEIVK